MRALEAGEDVAVWLNGRAKRVTPKVVQAFREALPRARFFVTTDLEAARREAAALAQRPPALLFCGGGDGTVAVLLNLLREAGGTPFPTVGLLKLGTGNGWPSATGAPPWQKAAKLVGKVPLAPPTVRFDLVEVEGRLCQFTGAGWDGVILHDYKRNLERRRQQVVGSRLALRLHTSILGYLYSVGRFTVPDELRKSRTLGRPRLTIENLGEPAWHLGRGGRPEPWGKLGPALFDGAFSVAGASTEPYYGGGFRAFPYALAMPGRMNVRVYDRPPLEAVRSLPQLWAGGLGLDGLNDWFVTKVRFRFSRPMPFQVAGDVVGPREELVFQVAKESIQLVRWDLLA